MNNLGLARNSYAEVGKEARVLSASAHQLITILLEELLNLLEEAQVLLTRTESVAIVDQQMMALSIVDSLSMSLDMDRGGQLAVNLKQLYGQVRQLISANDPATRVANINAAREIMKEIHSAWTQIG